MLDLTTGGLALKEGGRYIELGGGAHPAIRPNVDARWCADANGQPTVDFLVDLEKPFTAEHNQAIASDEFDGVYSRFALEHVSWRKTRDLLREINRILKPGGTLLLVLPNTEAQCRHLIESQDWEDGGSMLFGGQDYGENAHKAFFSPAFAQKLLHETGFANVEIYPYGALKTDMIVQAVKDASPTTEFKVTEIAVPIEPADISLPSLEQPQPEPEPLILDEAAKTDLRELRAAMFDRKYFDGGNEWGGYQSYRDFPCHEITSRHVLARRPESVLELGCGRGYVTKRLQDAGVPAHGWDVSSHAVLTRAALNVYQRDATDPSNWADYASKSIDLCLSVAFLDHVPEALLDDLIAGMARVCKRGLHGINPNPDGGADKTRCTIKPLDWWRKKLPEGHEVVTKDELETGQLPESFLRGDGKLKLQLGSFTTMYHWGWINIDAVDLREYAVQQGYGFLHHDLRNGLPFATESVDLIASHHCLEHLTYAEGFELLREIRRVLKPTGHLRLSVPDAELLIELYRKGVAENVSWDDVRAISGTVAACPTPARRLWEIMLEGHRAIYDMGELIGALARANLEGRYTTFRNHHHRYGSQQMKRETMEGLEPVSLFVEAIPAQ